MPGTARKKSTARRPAKPARGAAKRVPAKRARPAKAPAKRATAKKATPKTPTPKKATKAPKQPATKRDGKKTAGKKAAPKTPTPKKATKAKAPTKPAAKPAPPAKAATAAAKAAPAKASKSMPTIKPVVVPPTAAGKRGGKKTVICPLSGFEVTPAPANLSAKTLDRLRHKLLDEKARLASQAADLTAEAEQLAREREAGDTQFDEESGEGDTVNIERERDLLLSATARQVVDEIDDALDRVKRAKYGVCKPAGRKIALERLEAIPWAQVCVDCKARAERRR